MVPNKCFAHTLGGGQNSDSGKMPRLLLFENITAVIKSKDLHLMELISAKNCLVLMSQWDSFRKDLGVLGGGDEIRKTSPLPMVNPTIHQGIPK